MFLKRIYRFALKRLIGSFLVNNDIAMKDLDVKLRERTVELRNLNLDADVLNASLGLSEVRVVSALIENVTMSGKAGLAIRVSGVRIVLEPQRPRSNPTRSTPSGPDVTVEKGAAVDADGFDDLPDKSDSTSLTEGLSSVEGWIEQTMNMLKVEIVDVRIQIRLPSTISSKFPYYISVFVESCESQTNFEAATRHTELYGVHVSLLRSDDASFEKRIVYVEPSSSSDGRVCLIKAALDETFKERGYEVWLWAVEAEIDPETLTLLLTFMSLLSGVNSGAFEESPRVRIREDDSASEASAISGGGSEMFFDAQQSIAQSQMSFKEDETAKGKSGASTVAPASPPTLFNVQINGISLRLRYGQDCFMLLKGEGVVLGNAEMSISKLFATVENDSDSDLSITFNCPDSERAISLNLNEQSLTLSAAVLLKTSSRFKVLSNLARSYSSVGPQEIPNLKRSILLTPGSSSPPRFRIHSVPELAFSITGATDEVALKLLRVSADVSGLYATSGTVQIVRISPEASSSVPDVFLLLEKSVVVTLLDKSEQGEGVTAERASVLSESFHEEEGELPPLIQEVTRLENKWYSECSKIMDVSIGSIRTPDHLDPEVYQRVLAVLATSGVVSDVPVDREALIVNPPGLPCIRASSSFGRVSFAAAKSFPACAVEVRDWSILAYGSQMFARVQHVCCMEELSDSTNVPIVFSSRFASDAVPSVLALVQQPSISDMKIRVALSNQTYRLEPKSLGMTALSWFLAPDGRSSTGDVTFRADIRVDLEGLVVDVYPSQSPFVLAAQSNNTNKRMLPCTGRVLASVGKVSLATCETLSVLKRYDVEMSDVQLYLAQRSVRDANEHKYVVTRGGGLVIQEYAELNGFVRVGEMQRGEFFVRAENPTWDVLELEAVIPMFKMMTCADSLELLVEILNSLLDDGSKDAAPSSSSSSSPGSPILIMPRSTSIQTALGNGDQQHHLLDLNQIPDSELPASVLRQRAANAPDSSLNAKQLQARYRKDPYLLPHVIDDYYSLSTGPKGSRARSTAQNSARMEKDDAEEEDFIESRRVLGKHTSSSDLLAEFDIISVAPTPPPFLSPVTAQLAQDQERMHQNRQGVKKVSVSDEKPEMSQKSQRGRGKKRTFADDDDDGDDDSSVVSDEDLDEEDHLPGEEGGDVPMTMMRSVTFSKYQEPPLQKSPQDEEREEEQQSVQLIAMSEIESKAALGSAEAQQLHESILWLVSSTAEAGKDSNDMAESEANLYKTALLASSTMNWDEGATPAGKSRDSTGSKIGPRTWQQPGTAEASSSVRSKTSARSLATESSQEEEGDVPAAAAVEGLDEEEEEEELVEEDGVARYFDDVVANGGAEGVQVRAHHFPVPVLPKPGSFLPPRSIVAARIEGGGQIKDVNVRGKYRLILRECSFSWALFGGADFDPKQPTMYEPVYGLEEKLSRVSGEVDAGEEERRGGPNKQQRKKDDLVIMEDHFAKQNALFGLETMRGGGGARLGGIASRRDVNRVVEVDFKQLSLLLDAFGDGAMSLSLAVHDVELLDAVKASPVKKMVQHWSNERVHPRYTAEDMLRLTLDISAKNALQIHVASLPIRLIINQDTLELLNSFIPSSSSSSSSNDSSETPPSTTTTMPFIDVADFRALKLKVDYYPKRVDLNRLRSGRYSELVHLFSYEGMEVALKRAVFRQVRGLGALGTDLAEFWAEDVINRQLYQLLAGLSPSLKNIAVDMADIVLLPVDLLRGRRQDNNSAAEVASAAKTKAQKFARTIVIEGAGAGRKVASAALGVLDDKRTRRLPRDLPDGFSVAAQAMAARAKQVHHTIIAVPLTEWQRDGATGALKSVIRAIPVAILQPVLGLGEAMEAISSGVQYHLDPDEVEHEVHRWKNSVL